MMLRRHHNSLLNVLMFTGVFVTFFLFYNNSRLFYSNSKLEPSLNLDRFQDTSLSSGKTYSGQYPTSQLETNHVVFVASTSTTMKKSDITQAFKTVTTAVSAKIEEVTSVMEPSTTVAENVNDTSIFAMDQMDPRLISYIRQHHLTPPSKDPYANMTHIGLHSNSYSGYVRHLFRKKGQNFKGTFIEAGAYDGEVASNSLYLEEMGWTGILVECNPLLLPKLMAKNRKAWIANVCLSPTSTPKLMNFSTLTEWPASAKLGRPLNETEMKKHGIDWVSNKTWINYQIPCFPLYSIIKATGEFPEIDFLSLDVEGAEIEILKNFPFQNFKIKSMIVEVHTFTDEEKADLREFVGRKGYELRKKADNDDVYVLDMESEKDLV